MYIHEKLRPHQAETLDKIQRSRAKWIIIQMPTGGGKSFFPAQLAAFNNRVLACVKTKSLQRQYVNAYNFTELFGKSNYECLGFGAQEELDFGATLKKPQRVMADLCTVDDSFKGMCKATCPYPLARREFITSRSGTLNYSKFLLDRPVVEAFKPDYLFLDEAHELSDLVVNFSGITLRWNDKKLKQYASPIVISTPQPVAIPQGRGYLQSLMSSLENNPALHPSLGGDRVMYKYWERLKEKVDIVLAAMDIEPQSWYVYADDKHFVCKPLTARFHFQRLFDRAQKIVLMSATIGQTHLFTRELGITDYEFINVPNNWPAPLRPIEDLNGPKMGYRSSKEEWLLHSQIIANRINKCPDHWTGLVHSPSKWLSWDLAERLSQMTGREMFVPDERWGTEKAADEWLKIEGSGTICISWHFWEGVDSGKDNFCCVAKVPFVDFSNPFDKSRFMFDGKAGYSRIANKVVQGLGRIRRGHPEHYGNGRKVVCMADGNWTRVRKYIGKDILKAIV